MNKVQVAAKAIIKKEFMEGNFGVNPSLKKLIQHIDKRSLYM